ncbi:MAG TPA: ABC transporter substrate-binding protein [Chloroflexota bacterium]|nr:ABC transporter substrate-binding protein [Chloroflexota bacterium]
MGAQRAWWAGLLVVVLLGCQAAGPAAPPPAPAAPPSNPAGAPSGAPATASGTEAPARALPAPLSPPVTVRVGVLASISDSGIYIGLERGYYRELGLELQVETIPDPNTIGAMVNTNQLEVGGYGVNANPFLAAARGIGVKMVADKGQYRPGFGYAALLVRPDLMDSGAIRTLADLRGHTLAKLSVCDSMDPPIQRVLERYGLTRDDVQLTYLSFPDMNVALANRAVDVAFQIEPLMTLAMERGIGRKLAGGEEVYPYQQVAALYYSPAFASRTDAAQRFMVAYVRALRDYNDAFGKGVGRAEVVQILAKHTTVKDIPLYDKLVPAGLDPDGRLNVQGIRDDLALFGRLGCITGEIADVSQVVDESFVNYALSVLGPYAR